MEKDGLDTSSAKGWGEVEKGVTTQEEGKEKIRVPPEGGKDKKKGNFSTSRRSGRRLELGGGSTGEKRWKKGGKHPAFTLAEKGVATTILQYSRTKGGSQEREGEKRRRGVPCPRIVGKRKECTSLSK